MDGKGENPYWSKRSLEIGCSQGWKILLVHSKAVLFASAKLVYHSHREHHNSYERERFWFNLQR